MTPVYNFLCAGAGGQLYPVSMERLQAKDRQDVPKPDSGGCGSKEPAPRGQGQGWDPSGREEQDCRRACEQDERATQGVRGAGCVFADGQSSAFLA